MMSYGVVPFSSITKENSEKYSGWLVYDDESGVEVSEGIIKYDIVFNYLVDDLHNDIQSTGSSDRIVYPMYLLKYAGDDSFLAEIDLGDNTFINVDGRTWTLYQ